VQCVRKRNAHTCYERERERKKKLNRRELLEDNRHRLLNNTKKDLTEKG